MQDAPHGTLAAAGTAGWWMPARTRLGSCRTRVELVRYTRMLASAHTFADWLIPHGHARTWWPTWAHDPFGLRARLDRIAPWGRWYVH